MKTIRDVMDRWESAEALAEELGQKGVTVRQWRNRGGIPPRYWLALLEAAERRGFSDITPELLTRIHARPARETPASLGQSGAAA